MIWNELFHYCNGLLYWKISPNPRIKIGSLVGSPSNGGYLQTQLKGIKHKVHRLVWEMHNGPIPNGMQIDHIDHNRINNLLGNLRLVTAQDNMRNRSKPSNNTTGTIGVYWKKSTSKWFACIRVNGVNIHLGYFDKRDDALNARSKAETLYNFHTNHGK